MKFLDFVLKNKALSHFVLFTVFFGGIFAYEKMGKLEDAPFTIKQALVTTQYPGASAKEVEEQVSDVLEEAIQSLDELFYVVSENRAGFSKITVNVKKEIRADAMQQLWDKLRRKITDVQAKLPPGAKTSIVVDDFGDVLGVFYGLHGDGFTYRELKDYATEIKTKLLLVPGVAKVQLFGLQTPTIEVITSSAKLAEGNLNPALMLHLFNKQNQVIDAGNINTSTNKIRIAPTGSFNSIEKIGNYMVSTPSGEQIRLKDIATVKESYLHPYVNKMKINGKPAIGIAISTVAGGNVVDMSALVKKCLLNCEQDLPVGLEVTNIYDQGAESDKANVGFISNLIISVITVIIILLFFVGLRSGTLIGSGLIFSILGTLVIMYASGIALQRSSLAAIIIAMGMLVDNAIVVTDSILVGMSKGWSKKESIYQSVKASAMPLLGATLIAILTFMPIYLSPHITGEYFSSLFFVIAVSLGLSWLFAMSQTPLYCEQFLEAPQVDANHEDPFKKGLYLKFSNFLTAIIRRKWLTVGIVFAALTLSLFGFKYIPTVFMPQLQKEVFYIDMWTPEGTRIEQTESLIDEITKQLMKQKGVVMVTNSIGQTPPRYYLANNAYGPQSNYGQFIVKMESAKEVNAEFNKIIAFMAEQYPQVTANVNRYATMPALEASIEARFNGPDGNVLDSLCQIAVNIMKENPKVGKARGEWKNKVMVWNPRYNEAKAGLSGISRQDIASSLKVSGEGLPIGLFREKDNLVPILLRLNTTGLTDIVMLKQTPIWGAHKNTSIPLAQVLGNEPLDWEFSFRKRYNRQSSMAAQCNPKEGYTMVEVLSEIQPKIEAIQLPSGYSMFWDAEKKSNGEAMKALSTYFPLAFLLLVIILIALFGNFKQPLIIIIMLPLSLMGVILGLLLTGFDFGFNCIIGWLGLLGMIIKNVIVLLDEANLQITEGKSHLEAIIKATVSRTRPVLMAAITTIFGMIPLLFDSVFGSMATTIIFGLSFATGLTLIVVPAFYAIFYRVKTK